MPTPLARRSVTSVPHSSAPAPAPKQEAEGPQASWGRSQFEAAPLNFKVALPSTVSVRISAENDSFPPFLTGVFVPGDERMPRSPDITDDDGRTFGAWLEGTYTNVTSGQQLSVLAQYDMLTQDGANDSPGLARSNNARNDVLDVAGSFTQRFGVGPFVVDVGLGAGMQFVGPMAGLQIQEFWHRTFADLMGGRLVSTPGFPLQSRYTSSAVTAGPTGSAGVGVSLPLRIMPGVTGLVGASAQANLALGPDGLSWARAQAQGALTVDGAGSVRGSIGVASGWSNSEVLAFAPLNSLGLTWDVEAQVDAFQALGLGFSPVIAVRSGGPVRDTTYSIGIVFGAPDGPWLSTRR
jgi:hypothetical protein